MCFFFQFVLLWFWYTFFLPLYYTLRHGWCYFGHRLYTDHTHTLIILSQNHLHQRQQLCHWVELSILPVYWSQATQLLLWSAIYIICFVLWCLFDAFIAHILSCYLFASPPIIMKNREIALFSVSYDQILEQSSYTIRNSPSYLFQMNQWSNDLYKLIFNEHYSVFFITLQTFSDSVI